MSLAAITSYYNPEHYRTRRQNFDAFATGLSDAGIRLVVIEAAFGDDEFELDLHGHDFHRVRGRHVLWQKERLLNLALDRLPRTVRHIAWLDCDLIFENPDWGRDTVRMLKQSAVLQPFERVIRLPPRHALSGSENQGEKEDEKNGQGESWRSFAAVLTQHPNLLLSGDFARHGHTGFAWAARRDVLHGIGLYDGCIAGSGDHMMAHAFAGDWESRCIQRILCENRPHVEHFVQWSRRIYPRVRACMGALPGAIYHLWHGETADRRYVLRNRELAAAGFDPATDLRRGDAGLWEWNGERSDLQDWAIHYFKQRREDDVCNS